MSLLEDDDRIPRNLEAERAVLGAILVRGDALREIADILTAEDFFRSAHGTLFRRMQDLATAGRAIDLVTLMPVLERHGELDAVGGVAYITRLVDGLPRSVSAAHYALDVKAASTRRGLIAFAEKLRSDAIHGDDPDTVREAAEQALRGLDSGTGLELLDVKDAVAQASATLDAFDNAEHVGVTGVPTGLAGLDDLLGGWQRGDLNVIAGLSSHGKTALMAQCAGYAAIIRKVPTLFATNEQKPGSLVLRLACNRARVDLTAIRKKYANDDELARFADAVNEIARSPLTFYWARGKRMSDIRRHARMAKAKGRCDLLAIDYLGLIPPEVSQNRSETREREVARQSSMAKDVAGELDVPVLLGCQMNGDIEKAAPRGGKKSVAPPRPRLSDLRESKAVGHDADVVLFVHRPFARPSNPEERMRQGETDLIVAKQRNGAVGDVSAHFSGGWQRFEETT